jgi:DNA-binding transcriptional LysR family regulator
MTDRLRTGPDWADVRVFVALARYGSLSATARVLGVNHATVARRLAGLEQALRTKLFERRPTGYVLTALGRQALEPASAMEDAVGTLGTASCRSSSDSTKRALSFPKPYGWHANFAANGSLFVPIIRLVKSRPRAPDSALLCCRISSRLETPRSSKCDCPKCRPHANYGC